MYGVLSESEIEYYKEYFNEKILTDFAFANYFEYMMANQRERRSFYYGTSNVGYDETKKCQFFHTIDTKSNKKSGGYLYLKHLLFVPFLSLDFLPDRIKLDKNKKIQFVKFGLYPQTGYFFTNDVKVIETDIEESGYVFNGDFTNYGYKPIRKLKYKCIKINKYNKPNFSTGKEHDYIFFKSGSYNCYRVEPVEWVVDTERNIMFPRLVLFTNVPFLKGEPDDPTFYDGIKNHITIYSFIKEFFIPNVLQNEKVNQEELISRELETYTNIKSNKLLKEKKEELGKELNTYIDEIKDKITDKLFKNNEENLQKFCIDEEKKLKKEIQTNLNKYKKEELKNCKEKVVELEKEIESIFSEFNESIKTKEATLEYVKKEFDNIAKEEFDKKMLPLITKHKKDLEKIKQDMVLEISKLVGEYYNDFEEQINKLIDKSNANINVLEEKEQELKETINSFDKTKEELNKEVDLALERIKNKKEEIEKEIIEEVIRRVVEINPVKEVNITIDSVKKKGIKGLFHKDFEAILQLVSSNTMPVFLVGPAGCGKNVIIKQCAKVLDKDFYYQNDNTEEHKLLGFVDANGVYHKTPFYEAFTKGGLLMLDEMDNSDPSVLLKLNSAMGTGSDFYITFPNGEFVKAHEDFQVVAAANTFGRGANNMYVGRNSLDMASLDRFFIYQIDYDRDLERTLVTNKEILNLFWEVRDIVANNDIMHVVSTRAILNMDKIISSNIIGKGTFTLDSAFKGTLIKGLDEEDLRIIVSRITGNDHYSKEFIRYGEKVLKELEEKRKEMENRARTNQQGYAYQKTYGGY